MRYKIKKSCTLSASELAMYQSCPLKFRVLYVDQLSGEERSKVVEACIVANGVNIADSHNISVADFRANVNQNCCSCEYRLKCDDYRATLDGALADDTTSDDIHEVVREWERISVSAKLAEERKKELDERIKDYVMQTAEWELVSGGKRYEIVTYTKAKYPILKILEYLWANNQKGYGYFKLFLQERGMVDKKTVEELVRRLSKDSAERARIDAELLALADKHSSQRLYSRKVTS